jgi:hypothetical protein
MCSAANCTAWCEVITLLSACLQVVFDAETLKYPWYFPRRLLTSIAVFISTHQALRGSLDIIAFLSTISAHEIAERRALLQQLAFSLQYSITDSSNEDLVERGPDAVEVALANLLRHSSTRDGGIEQ